MRGSFARIGQGTLAVGLGLTLSLPAIAQAQMTTEAFVPSWTNARVTVLDAFTGNVAAPIIAMQGEPYDAAVTPDGRLAYVTRRASNRVSVIDVATKTVVATIAVGAQPLDVAIAPNGKRVYVTEALSNRLTVIDVATQRVIDSIPVARMPWGIAIAPDGRTAYVVNRAVSTVSAIDLVSGLARTTVSVDTEPVEAAIAPDGTMLYVTSTIRNTVVPIALPSLTVLPSIPVGTFPTVLTITPDGGTMFVSNSRGDTVSVVDMGTHTVTATLTFPTGTKPYGQAITPDGTRLILGSLAGDVRFLDVATLQEVQPLVSVGGQALRLTLTPNLIAGGGAPLTIADDRELDTRGFRDNIVFHGGTLQATSSFATARRLSLLSTGGTIDTQDFSVEIAGGTINSGSLVKRGRGTLTLSGVSAHPATVVQEGMLNVTGSHAAPIACGPGGVLAGTGTVGNVDAPAGAISPGGDTVGVLSAKAVTMGPTHRFVVDIDGSAPNGTATPGASDRLAAASVAINGASLAVRLRGAVPVAGQRFTIATNTQGEFFGMPEGTTLLVGPATFLISYPAGTKGHDVVLISTSAPSDVM